MPLIKNIYFLGWVKIICGNIIYATNIINRASFILNDKHIFYKTKIQNPTKN